MGAQRHIDERAKYVEDAKTSAFIDAVYIILKYNGSVRPFANSKLPPISPQEIFGNFNQDEFDACCKRCEKLDQAAGEVAKAEYGYSGCTQTGDEAYKRFIESHSDFSGGSKGSALWKARISLR